MPLFKRQDMWQPNKQYVTNARLKSVILHNEKLYVCNTTHTSTNVFDDEKFTQLGGRSGGSNFTVDLENGINLTPTLTNIRNGYVRETYNCTLQQNGEYETLVAGTELTNIANVDYKVYGVSCGLINHPSSDIHTIDYLLPSNFANGELKYVLVGYCNESYSIVDILINAFSTPSADFRWSANVLLTESTIGQYFNFLRTNDGGDGVYLPTTSIPPSNISLTLNSSNNQIKLNNNDLGEFIVGNMLVDAPLKAFFIVFEMPTNQEVTEFNVKFNNVKIADFGDVDFGSLTDGDIAKVGIGGLLGGVKYKANDLIVLYNNKQNALLYYTNPVVRTVVEIDRSVYGSSYIYLLDTNYKANKKYKVKLFILHSTDNMYTRTMIRLTPNYEDRNDLKGLFTTLDNDTNNSYGKYYNEFQSFITTNGLNGNDKNMVIVFEGIFEPENDGIFSVGFACEGSSFVYMKKDSYLELEEIN